MRTDDVETFAAHPAQVGRILFGGEFLRQLFRDDGVLGHALLLPLIALSLVTPAFVAGIHVFMAAPRRGWARLLAAGSDAFVRLHSQIDRNAGRRAPRL